MRIVLLLLISSISICLFGQISSIHPIEPASNHYAEFQQLDDSPREAFALMDTLRHPPEKYSYRAIQFAMAKPNYLTTDQVDYLVKSVSFPANSSVQTRQELDFLMQLQKENTPEVIERIQHLAGIGYWPDANYKEDHPRYQKNLEHLFFECREVVGVSCTADKYPQTANLLKGVMNDMRLMEFAVKYHLLRPRPYALEPQLTPLTTVGSPSFASGHTIWAYIQAYTWSELMPDRRSDFLHIAYELGFSREQLGVHYPSDEEVARQLAHRMLLLMWHTDKFQSDFAAAQAEWSE